jgi:hypothetical protein
MKWRSALSILCSMILLLMPLLLVTASSGPSIAAEALKIRSESGIHENEIRQIEVTLSEAERFFYEEFSVSHAAPIHVNLFALTESYVKT